MTSIRILLVGFDPATMALDGAPAGTAAKIQEGIDHSMVEMEKLGFDAAFCSLDEGDDGAEQVLSLSVVDEGWRARPQMPAERLVEQHS